MFNLAAGVLAGILIAKIIGVLRRPDGVLKIDTTNPERDSYLFEIADLDKLSKKRRIILKVKHLIMNSQK